MGLGEVKVEDSLKKPLIQSRVMIMGEGRMPNEVIQGLSDEHPVSGPIDGKTGVALTHFQLPDLLGN